MLQESDFTTQDVEERVFKNPEIPEVKSHSARSKAKAKSKGNFFAMLAAKIDPVEIQGWQQKWKNLLRHVSRGIQNSRIWMLVF